MFEHNTPYKTYHEELKDPAVSNKLMQIIDGLKEDQCVLLKPSDEPFLRTQLVYEIVNKNLSIYLLEINDQGTTFQNALEQIRFTPEFHRKKMLEIEQNALGLLPMEKGSYIQHEGGKFVYRATFKEGHITEMMQDYYLRNVHHKYIVHCVTKCWKVR
mgnify:CR=1 FL=1